MGSGSIARLLLRLDVHPSECLSASSSLHTAFAFAPTPASYTPATLPVSLSRPQGPQLACCPGIHATACATCLFCYRTPSICRKDAQIVYATARLGVAWSQHKSRSERNTHTLMDFGESFSGNGSWRRNHGLSQAGLSVRKHAVPGCVHLTSPGQTGSRASPHSANAGFCPVINPTLRNSETMHVHTYHTLIAQHRHIAAHGMTN